MVSETRVYADPGLVPDNPGFKLFAETGLPTKLCWRRHRVAPEFCFEFVSLTQGGGKQSLREDERKTAADLECVGRFSSSLGPVHRPVCLDRSKGSVWIVADAGATGIEKEPHFVNSDTQRFEKCFAEFERLNALFPHPVRDREGAVRAWTDFEEFVFEVDPAVRRQGNSFWLSRVGEKLEAYGVL